MIFLKFISLIPWELVFQQVAQKNALQKVLSL